MPWMADVVAATGWAIFPNGDGPPKRIEGPDLTDAQWLSVFRRLEDDIREWETIVASRRPSGDDKRREAPWRETETRNLLWMRS